MAPLVVVIVHAAAKQQLHRPLPDPEGCCLIFPLGLLSVSVETDAACFTTSVPGMKLLLPSPGPWMFGSGPRTSPDLSIPLFYRKH